MGRYLKNKPRGYRNELTKQVNVACDCHGHMSKWLRKKRNREIKDECPSCGEAEPYTQATRCEDSDGNLMFACDGSYMEKLDPERCSAAFVLRCKQTGKTAKGTMAEKERHASNIEANSWAQCVCCCC